MPDEDELIPIHESWMTMAALSRDVPRLRIGTLVTGNTYRHPAVLAKMTAESPELQNHEEMKAAIGKVKGVETRLLATVENFGMWQKLCRAIYTAETLDAAIGELMGIYSSWPNRHEESARRPEYTAFFKYGLKLGTEQASLRVNAPT